MRARLTLLFAALALGLLAVAAATKIAVTSGRELARDDAELEPQHDVA